VDIHNVSDLTALAIEKIITHEEEDPGQRLNQSPVDSASRINVPESSVRFFHAGQPSPGEDLGEAEPFQISRSDSHF
jgi:hypothetical protein